MSDLTTDTMAVGEQDGMVVISFPKPVQWATFDPETAKNIGMAMAKTSYELTTNSKTDASGAKILSETMQAKLVTRLTHVIRNLSEKGKPPGFIAEECMTVILREVY